MKTMNLGIDKFYRVPFPGWEAIEGQEVFKYKSLDYALRHSTPFIRDLITDMPNHTDYKYLVIDVKIIELKTGQLPCQPGLHYDCVTDYHHPSKLETHYIYQLGAGSYTSFLHGGLRTTIEPETVYRYGRTLHEAQPAQYDGRRLLVRKTFTDVVKPI